MRYPIRYSSSSDISQSAIYDMRYAACDNKRHPVVHVAGSKADFGVSSDDDIMPIIDRQGLHRMSLPFCDEPTSRGQSRFGW